MIRIAGKIFGAVAIFFAVLVILHDIAVFIAPKTIPMWRDLWLYINVLSLLCAGLSGFCKNTILSRYAIIVSVFYPIIGLFLFPDFTDAGPKISFMLLMISSPYLAIYLFAISGMIFSIVKR
jgi:hypothetical protein